MSLKERKVKATVFITSLILAVGLAACGSSKDATSTEQKDIPKAELVDDFSSYRDNAAVNIQSILIKGNLMTIHVNYSGGCEKHEFKLLGSKMLEKTMPPKRGVTLYHDNKGDSCRELVDEILVFDITALGISKQEVILMIDGHETPHPYKAP